MKVIGAYRINYFKHLKPVNWWCSGPNTTLSCNIPDQLTSTSGHLITLFLTALTDQFPLIQALVQILPLNKTLHFVFLFTSPNTFNVQCDLYTYFFLPLEILVLWGWGSHFVHLCIHSDLRMRNKYVFSCIYVIFYYSWVAFQWIFHYPVSLFMCISERGWQDVSKWALPDVGTFVKSPW